MHILQPKHSKLKPDEAKKLLEELNVSLSQLPKITSEDPALPKDCITGNIIKIERDIEGRKVNYFRVVI